MLKLKISIKLINLYTIFGKNLKLENIMKKLLTILKLVNNWTNHQISAEEEAQQILKFLILKNDTKRVIDVYEALEKAIESEMDNRAFEALRNARLIQGKWGVKSIVKDPIFEKPINEIKVTYETIN